MRNAAPYVLLPVPAPRTLTCVHLLQMHCLAPLLPFVTHAEGLQYPPHPGQQFCQRNSGFCLRMSGNCLSGRPRQIS